MDPVFDLAVTDALLSTTRAVRKRLDLEREVPIDVVLDCLRLAVQAPTASNSQTWRWIVVTDPDKRAALGELYRQGGGDYLSGQAAKLADSGTQDGRVFGSAAYLAEVMGQVPVHVIPCVQGRIDGAPNVMAASVYGSIIPAAWSFQLALRARGLGTAWTTLHLVKEKEAAELLGIPDDVTQVALLPVAWTKGTDFKPARRPPVEDITYVDTWGTTA